MKNAVIISVVAIAAFLALGCPPAGKKTVPAEEDIGTDWVDDEPAACDETAYPVKNGGIAEAAGAGGCPPGMVPIPGRTACVDAYEAFLVKVSDGSPWSPYQNPGTEDVKAMSAAGAVPQGYINQIQAAAACAAAGKRLCTDAEWLAACKGSAGKAYPYGSDTRVAGSCNDSRAVHPAVEYFGTADSWIYSELDNPCLNQLAASLAKAGAFPDCESDGGAYDMVGNLHEWTADPAGTFRGGFYVEAVLNGKGCDYATTAHAANHWDYSTGFRCCVDSP